MAEGVFMEVEIKIEPEFKHPKIVVYTDEVTKEISDMVKFLSGKDYSMIAGYKGNEIILMKQDDIVRIYTCGQKVLARLENETVQLKYRLYELENRLSDNFFARISNSEIVNFNKVKSLDLSITGTITLKLKNGEKSFVSRRYVEKIKSFLELK
jgi:DNA-binding LytR/AlgR family response regulator